MSSNKKKMAQYMREDLLKIAKSNILTVEPSLNFKIASKPIFAEATKAIQKYIYNLFPNKEDMKVLLKYKVAVRLGTTYQNGYQFTADVDVPNTFNQYELHDTLKDYCFKLTELENNINKQIKEKLKPFISLVNSCNYLEDIATFWPNEDVIKYIENNTKKVLKSSALTVFTKEDKQQLDDIERRLKDVKKDN